jgi:hypothetical protein
MSGTQRWLSAILDRTSHMTLSALQNLLRAVQSHWIPPQEVRREALALGGRHMGDVLAGARKEMAEPDILFRRSVLLRAVIRQDGRNKAASKSGGSAMSSAKPKKL